MPIPQLYSVLTAPVVHSSRSRTLVWFYISLAIAAVFAGCILHEGFSHPYMVQDDARQHVFWMARFRDPELFPNDLIANYFQSVAPWGYTTLYRLVAGLGIEPIVFSKIVPALILLVTTVYCFGTCLQILPVPIAGCLASVLLNQSLVMADDVNSGTPRAFVYPLFLAFLYYLLKDARLPCLTAIALLGLFYPQAMLVACGVMICRLLVWSQGHVQISDRSQYLLSSVAIVVGGMLLLLYSLKGAAEFGPALTVAEARLMPEFWGDGRASFFSNDPFNYWIVQPRSGMLPGFYRLLKPPLMLTGLLLPVLMCFPVQFPLVQRITPKVQVLAQVVVPSIVLFFLAHAVLFRLHHPSRYTQHSYRIVMTLAAGIALTVLLDALLHWVKAEPNQTRSLTTLGITTVMTLLLLVYPVTEELKQLLPGLKNCLPTEFLPGYVVGRDHKLYQFLAQQPKDSMIASLTEATNNLPIFAQRSVLVAKEYAMPYHKAYYQQVRQRAIDLIQAQYTPIAEVVQRFITTYGIDFWIVERDTFKPNYLNSQKSWLWQYQPVTQMASEAMHHQTVPVVQQLMAPCTVLQQKKLRVLDATCMTKQLSSLRSVKS
ncbi:hypothetical protein [Pantanalinema sp. GBBB05]|uniref:hypothetical protein n=1 Tax=Pantanalinema sp. GBBB05 TaxID=2604139 RepID=UPI001DBCC9C4|nr:hypothetical protein [Pantanalinema sp. GBBB05]